MDLGIAGRTALVTGGGGGLGSAISRQLAAEGAKVVVADLDIQAAEAARAAIGEAGGEALALAWDIGDLELIEEKVGEIESALGTIDILVNISGGPAAALVTDTPVAGWTAHFQSMVAATIAITNRVLPAMRQQGWGRVVTSTSSGVVAPIPNLGVSNSLRLALVGWSKTLAREIAPDGVTANIVVPGRVATGRIRYLDEAKAGRENRPLDEIVAESTASIPMRRYGDPEEYADAVAFLASERASYITGSVMRVDGGYIPSV